MDHFGEGWAVTENAVSLFTAPDGCLTGWGHMAYHTLIPKECILVAGKFQFYIETRR